MAYQNVGTPRFYIDLLSYNQSIGNIGSLKIREHNVDTIHVETDALLPHIGLEPSNPLLLQMPFNNQEPIYELQIFFKEDIFIQDKNFWHGVFNHNCKTTNTFWWGRIINSGNTWVGDRESAINYDTDGYGRVTDGNFGYIEDGFSIMIGTPVEPELPISALAFKLEVNDMVNADLSVDTSIEEGSIDVNFGCFATGTYYDMPHSPELDLTMTTESDGYRSNTTRGGAHFRNIKYMGAPMWERTDGTEVPPWTIGEPAEGGKRAGRRTWNLSFNYLSEKDLFSSNYSPTTFIQNGVSSENDTYHNNNDLTSDRSEFYYTLENDNSFYAQVLNRVGDGQRFLFQPDSSNNNPDQFAIAVIENNSIEIERVTKTIYNIKLKIVEVW